MNSLTGLTGRYAVDTANSWLTFVARQRPGPSVHGRFDEFEGHVALDGDKPSASHVALEIHTASIDTHHRQRDRHLRARFLATAAHPLMAFGPSHVNWLATGLGGHASRARPRSTDWPGT